MGDPPFETDCGSAHKNTGENKDETEVIFALSM